MAEAGTGTVILYRDLGGLKSEFDCLYCLRTTNVCKITLASNLLFFPVNTLVTASFLSCRLKKIPNYYVIVVITAISHTFRK